MIKVIRYEESLKERWNDFCKKSKNGIFMFNRDYMDYHSDRFKDHSLLFYNEDSLVALLPVNEYEHKLYSHGGLTFGGFICGEHMKQHIMQDCFTALRDYMYECDLKSVLYKKIPYIYNLKPSDEDLYSIYVANGKIEKVEPATVIDLCEPYKMTKGRKAQISRAKREGIKIVELTKLDDFCVFIDLENEVLKERHNTQAVHTGAELKLLKDRFPDNIHLYGAFDNNNMIAGTVIYEYVNTVHTQYMAANNRAREIGALDYTIKYLIDYYTDSKRWFDFGISSEDEGRTLNEGLISQKEGFGGRTMAYITLTLYGYGGGIWLINRISPTLYKRTSGRHVNAKEIRCVV